MGPDLALEYEETANSTPARGMQPGTALFYKESHFPYQSHELQRNLWGKLKTVPWTGDTRVQWECLVRRRKKEVNQYEILQRRLDWWGRKKRWWQIWSLR